MAWAAGAILRSVAVHIRAAVVSEGRILTLAKLRNRLAYIQKAAAAGNIQAVQAQLAILREMNEITGLHKQRWIDETIQQRELTESEEAEAIRLAGIRLRQGVA